eukprot:COSAG02_NODE_6727_length_3396_cov_2.243710_5_plen_80_part_00
MQFRCEVPSWCHPAGTRSAWVPADRDVPRRAPHTFIVQIVLQRAGDAPGCMQMHAPPCMLKMTARAFCKNRAAAWACWA